MSSSGKAAFVTSVFITLLISVLLMGSRTNDAQTRGYTLTIINNSGKDIHRLHMSSSGTGRWGPDLLGRTILRSGESRSWGDIGPGEYDLLLIDASENQCVLRSVRVFGHTQKSTDNCWR
jgi:hypothetical protein